MRQIRRIYLTKESSVGILGIDIGGSGIKGAIVDVEKGEFITERHRIETPQPSTPEAMAGVIKEIVQHFDYNGPVGCTFPGVVQHGVIHTAANVDKSWVEVSAEELFQQITGMPVHILNDADAAGVAEMHFGAGRDRQGVVIMLTFGTGIGSAIFTDGHLVPNTEFGHMKIRGKDAEHRASARIREDEELSWKRWSKRVNEFLQIMDFLFSPDLFIIGGGVSKKFDKYASYLDVKAELVPAQLRNDAGIIGAAMAAYEIFSPNAAATPPAPKRKPATRKTATDKTSPKKRAADAQKTVV
ncbi:MAG: ROK family protein [Caldilineaceae bacterium]|nr:ROK family protein [Caldilineaceae bacterium]